MIRILAILVMLSLLTTNVVISIIIVIIAISVTQTGALELAERSRRHAWHPAYMTILHCVM